MNRRFIIAFQGRSVAQENAITNLLRQKQVGWWHWIANVWLIVDSRNQFTAQSLAEEVSRVTGALDGTSKLFVSEIDEKASWYAKGASKMLVWLGNTWKRSVQG